MGCRHSSVDLSAPSILLPRVWVPSTPSILFSIYKVQIVYLSLKLECKKNKNKQKEAGIGPFFKQRTHFYHFHLGRRLGSCNWSQKRNFLKSPNVADKSLKLNFKKFFFEWLRFWNWSRCVPLLFCSISSQLGSNWSAVVVVVFLGQKWSIFK